MIKQPTLPDKPSDLIRVSVGDMILIKKDPKYVIDMNSYHNPHGKACHVCLAGSVIAKTFNFNKHQATDPGRFDHITKGKLRALDDFRTGYLFSAFFRLNLSLPKELPNNYFDYEDDYDQKYTVHDDF